MSNPSTVFASSERPVDLEGSTGFSDGGQLVGGKGSIRATSSPKQGEEKAGLDALEFDINKIAEKYNPELIPPKGFQAPCLMPFNSATLANIATNLLSGIRSEAKKVSDMHIFEAAFNEMERRFDKWEQSEGAIVGGDIDTQYLKQKVKGEDKKKIKDYTKKRLHYNVLDKCNGWSRAKLWWTTIVCMMTSARGEYDTPNKGEEKDKDPCLVDISNKREFNKWVGWLDDWLLENPPTSRARMDQVEEHKFFQFAYQAIFEDDRMIGTRKKKLYDLLGKVIGRSYEEIVWATIASFGFGVGSKGPYKTWEERFAELEQYKLANGNLNVPRGIQGSLDWWVASQRAQYKKFKEGKKTKLTQDGIDRLDELGFTW